MGNIQCFQTAYQDPNSVILQACITKILRTPLHILFKISKILFIYF